jgi:hypothetical protein
MTSGPEGPSSAAPARDSSDDTVELELTKDQELALSRAAAAALRSDDPDLVPAVAKYMNLAYRPTTRIEFVCNVTLAVLAVGLAIGLLWPKPDRQPAAPAVASVARVAEMISAAPPPKPEGPPVRITNAFDAREVFEFPSGTSESEAREAVVELLLSRARERRAEGLALRRGQTRQRGLAAPGQQPKIFVTRLLARTKVPLNETN